MMAADDATGLLAEALSEPVAVPAILLPNGTANTTAESLLAAGGPGDPTLPGFNNVARSGDNGTVVYLGAGWVLTANHVALTSTITFAGESYVVDTSSVTRLTNADGTNTDLKMFKVVGNPPVPELFTSYIASAPASGHVYMVGNGYATVSEKHWSVNRSLTPWVWTEISKPANYTSGNYGGVTTTGPRVVRWGENTVHDTDMYMPIGGVNVAGFTTRFDHELYTNQHGLTYEAQASSGDSGGAVFSLQNGKWVLSGIMLAVSGTLSGQPSNTAIYGGVTFIADISAYRTQILSIAGVVHRQLVYNQSAFDNNTPGVGTNEDAAIAPDKSAYRAGTGLSTFNNVSSYSHGINSIAIDIASVHGDVTAQDFDFRIGQNSALNTWSEAPSPTLVTVRSGAGIGGSDRVHILWPNDTILNTWLEVTVKGNDALGGFNTNTGLAKSDVFYFGHRTGDAGGNSANAAVTGLYDELGARNHTAIFQPITNPYDFDKNMMVGLSDQMIARMNIGILLMVDLPATAAAASLAEEDEDVNGLIELPPSEEPLPAIRSMLAARAQAFAAYAVQPEPLLTDLFTSNSWFHSFWRRTIR